MDTNKRLDFIGDPSSVEDTTKWICANTAQFLGRHSNSRVSRSRFPDIAAASDNLFHEALARHPDRGTFIPDLPFLLIGGRAHPVDTYELKYASSDFIAQWNRKPTNAKLVVDKHACRLIVSRLFEAIAPAQEISEIMNVRFSSLRVEGISDLFKRKFSQLYYNSHDSWWRGLPLAVTGDDIQGHLEHKRALSANAMELADAVAGALEKLPLRGSSVRTTDKTLKLREGIIVAAREFAYRHYVDPWRRQTIELELAVRPHSNQRLYVNLFVRVKNPDGGRDGSTSLLSNDLPVRFPLRRDAPQRGAQFRATWNGDRDAVNIVPAADLHLA